MIDEYKAILISAASKHKEFKMKIQNYRKNRKANIFEKISSLHIEAFKKIDCLKCANCCRNLGPIIKEKDISRISKLFKEKPGKFVNEYLKIDEDSDYVFKEMPCPFLQEDNLCIIYDMRPDACRKYPYTDQRAIRKLLNQLYKDRMTCPAVVYILEKM